MYILAGEFKGRKLLGPPGRSITRPITGAAKKSLFDTIAGYLDGAAVVDLYCGTGTMGLEALSRGARRCAFAELDRRVVDCLRRNIQTLGVADRSLVWQGDLTRRLAGWLAELGEPVGVAFVDPPYADAREWDWPAMDAAIFAPLAERLAPDGLVVLRTPGGVEVPPKLGRLDVARTRTYGDMVVTIFCLEDGTGDQGPGTGEDEEGTGEEQQPAE